MRGTVAIGTGHNAIMVKNKLDLSFDTEISMNSFELYSIDGRLSRTRERDKTVISASRSLRVCYSYV